MSRPIHPFGDGRDDADAEAGDGGRDSRGRFTRGNAGGPGNPHGRRTAQLRAALLGAIRPADLAAIGQSLLSAALAGDVAAAKLLLAYTIGQPGDAPADVAAEPGIRIIFETKPERGSNGDAGSAVPRAGDRPV